MPCGWEGNRRSGVSLAMRHRLQWLIHLRADGLRERDEDLLRARVFHCISAEEDLKGLATLNSPSTGRASQTSVVYPHTLSWPERGRWGPEMDMGWVHPWVGLGWVGLNENYCAIVAEYCKTHTFIALNFHI